MKNLLKLFVILMSITRITIGIEFIDKVEPLLENSHLVGAWIVATAGLAAGAAQQKLTTYYEFKDLAQAPDITILDSASQKFLQEFRKKNKGIISIDIVIPILDTTATGLLSATASINCTLPIATSVQSKYSIAPIEKHGGNKASSSTSLSNQQDSHFALVVNQHNQSNPGYLTNAQLDSLRVAAEHLSQSQVRANRIAIRREVKNYITDFTPETRHAGVAQEVYVGAIIEREREKQKDLDILEKNPEILKYDASIHWMHIALHLDEVTFIKRFIKDPRMQVHPTVVKRLIEIIKNVDQVTLDIFLNQLFPADTFIRLFPILADRANLFSEAHPFEDRLLEINNHKHLFNAYEQRLLEDLVHSISRFREAITLASALLKGHTSFWLWGPSDDDSQKLLALFIALSRSKARDKLQLHFNKTSDYSTLLKIVAKIKTKEMRDYLADTDIEKNYLAYAFEVEEFITFVGPLISKNSKEYVAIIRLASQHAIAFTLTSFEELLYLTRASGIPGSLVAHRYRNPAQRNVLTSLIRSFALLRSRAEDTAAVDKLVHLGLIASVFGKMKEAEKTQNLLLQLQKIYISDELQAKEKKRNKALADLSKAQIKKYDDFTDQSITPETNDSKLSSKRLRYDLDDGKFYPDCFDSMIASLPIPTSSDDNSGASSSAAHMPPMLDPDSESSEDSENEKITIEEYRAGIEELKKKYGEQKVDEVINILNIKESKVKNPNSILQIIEEYINVLQKINSDPRWSTFKYDPANRGKITEGTLREARVGIHAEEQCFLQELNRSPNGGEEFVDINKISWDVKSPLSRDLYDTKNVFNLRQVFNSIKQEYGRGENPIINISHLNQKDLLELITKLNAELSPQEKARTLLIDYYNPANSGFMGG